jgi:hypothetical protein
VATGFANEGNEREAFMSKVEDDDALVAALTPAQLHAAHLIHNRNAEQARRQGRAPEEAERVKAADRARKRNAYAKSLVDA